MKNARLQAKLLAHRRPVPRADLSIALIGDGLDAILVSVRPSTEQARILRYHRALQRARPSTMDTLRLEVGARLREAWQAHVYPSLQRRGYAGFAG